MCQYFGMSIDDDVNLEASMSFPHRALGMLLLAPALARAQRVGPAHGTVMVVGGGGLRPAIYKEFIERAGGPDALIVLVPTAGGDSVYSQAFPGKFGWTNAGAKNLYVLHTTDAESPSTSTSSRGSASPISPTRSFRNIRVCSGFPPTKARHGS
jgi:hypothetical protein